MAYSEAQNKATQKYIKENLEEIRFRVRKGERDKLHAAAAERGQSTAQFVIHAVNEYAGEQVLTPAKTSEE